MDAWHPSRPYCLGGASGLASQGDSARNERMDHRDPGCRAEYQGDAVLARLLAKAGSPYDPAGLRGLIEGVAAAPPGVEWLKLVAADVSPALAAQLQALRREVEAARLPAAAPDRAARLALLRAELARRGIAGFIVPRADEHQGEYVPARARRLTWLTGFSGSAVVAIILAEEAAIFVDGRYTLQVRTEADPALFEFCHQTEQPPAEWIAAHLGAGQALGYDPWLHTSGEVERYAAAAAKAGGNLAAQADNPVDAVWRDQPPPPLAPVVPHELRFAGQAATEKRTVLAASLTSNGIDAAILSLPDSIAWLLNIRGGDVPHTPLPLSFAILNSDASVELFIDRRKLVPGIESHLGNAVAVQPPQSFGPALDRLGRSGKRLQLDPASVSAWILARLENAGAAIHRAADPCQLPKARKNPAELTGARAAHRRDGAALTRFL